MIARLRTGLLPLTATLMLLPACGGSGTSSSSGGGGASSTTTTTGAAGSGAGGGAAGGTSTGGSTSSAGGTSTGGTSTGGSATGGAGGTTTTTTDTTSSTGPLDCDPAACVCPYHGPIAGYAEHDGLRAIEATNFVLHDTGTWDTASAHFDALGLPKVSLDALPLNRTGTAPAGALKTTLQGMVSYHGGFNWESGDQSVTYWVPQGITPGVTAGGKKMVAASWHYDETHIADDPNPPQVGGDKGIRVSFADVSALGGDVPYRHVLFVEEDAATGFRSINIHAGGVAWVGPYLYVADTGHGVRVFDSTRILKVSTDAVCADTIGANGAVYCAFGYGYILPQVGAFTFPSGLSSVCKPVFSFISYDATSSPPSIVSGEYDNDPVTGIYSRLLRWPLDAATSKLAPGPTGTVHPAEAFYAGNRNLQGAASVNGKLFLDSTRYSGALFTGAVNQASKVYKATSGQWVYMAEGIQRADDGLLWVITEGHASMPRIAIAAKPGEIP
ncbi:MAG: hypothetical protein U0441_17670 [Polyangiaceae bacterium]